MAARKHVLLLLVISILAVMAVEKRSDDLDVQSLMTLVQQQATKIDQQAATIQTMQAQLTSLQTTVHQQSTTITNVTNNLSAVSQRVDTRVSFTAYRRDFPMTLNTSPFLFDVVVTNIGGAYSSVTGVFTAPVSGIYIFYAKIMNKPGSDRVDWAIFKSSTLLCANENDGSNLYDKASCLATPRVEKGEQVYVKRINSGTVIEGNRWCSFSGTLVSADP